MDQNIDIKLNTSFISEPSLPSLPSSNQSNRRKRPFLQSHTTDALDSFLADAINTSSDPALFSCDETPDLENYVPGLKRRKKKTYKGTWWDNSQSTGTTIQVNQKLPTTKGRTRFQRNFDSGIFMSDDSNGIDLSSESLLEQDNNGVHDQATFTGATPAESNTIDDSNAEQISEAKSGMIKMGENKKLHFSAEATAEDMRGNYAAAAKNYEIRAIVSTCLDRYNNVVDLTGMGLDQLPSFITELKSMLDLCPGRDEEIMRMYAPLKVYLGNNNFTKFPLVLLEIDNIHHLSLRQNSLTEIPHGILTLRELEVLNISGNPLPYLPWTMLKLLKENNLKSLNATCNDQFLQLPVDHDRWHGGPDLLVITISGVKLRRRAVSKPVECNANGTFQEYKPRLNSSAGNAPHLSEVVLRSLFNHNSSKADLTSYLSEYNSTHVEKQLSDLHSSQMLGGYRCYNCGKQIVCPRYVWFEWWESVWTNEGKGRYRPRHCDIVYGYTYGFTLNNPPARSGEFCIPFKMMSCECQNPVEVLEEEMIRHTGGVSQLPKATAPCDYISSRNMFESY